MLGFNADLQSQIDLLCGILKQNKLLYDAVKAAEKLDMPNYYIAAGCIPQTVWNYLTNRDLMYGISDFDFIYYDDSDLSYEAENAVIEKVRRTINLPIELDIKNQARVHLWYKNHFGYDIEPYQSAEDSINKYETISVAVGIRLENGVFKVYAPFGLNDLFGMIMRPNKVQITKEIYQKKVDKWTAKWSELTVIEW